MACCVISPNQRLTSIEPRRIRGRAMDVIARLARQPGLDLGICMRGVVAHDPMNIQRRRHRLVDVTQKTQELRVLVARFALCEHLAIGHIQGGEQRGRAVTKIIVPDAFNVTQAQR